MRAPVALLAALALSCSTADTVELSRDATGVPSSLDAAPPDAAPELDAGASCVTADDCPGAFPACDAEPCGCGSFKQCVAGSCRAASHECHPDAALPPDGGASCARASDCRGPPLPSARTCASSAYSCVEGQCLWECEGARSCAREPRDCYGCDGDLSCPGMQCPFMLSEGEIEDATPGCVTLPGTTAVLAGSRVRVQPTARPCSYMIAVDGAAPFLGTFLQYDDFRYFGDFPSLGGRCTAVQAPTGALRLIFSCPVCQLTIRL